MSNWCSNKLIIDGPKDKVRKFVKEAKGIRPWDEYSDPKADREVNDLCFNKHVPFPKKLTKGDFSNRAYTDVGHYWESKNWGCKWGACETMKHPLTVKGNEATITYTFNTPWCPPTAWLERVSKIFPRLRFTLDYYELGNCFAGTLRAMRGNVSDNYVEGEDEFMEWMEEHDPEEFEFLSEMYEESRAQEKLCSVFHILMLK